jgi:branched-chain amino acid transport system permease protein
MSVGAFSGILLSQWMGIALPAVPELPRLILALVFGGAMAGVAGVLIGIPVLRLRGDYLAIVTLAFGEIIRNLMNCLYISLVPGSVEFVPSAADPNVFTKTHVLDKLNIDFNVMPDASWQLLVNGPQGATGVDKIATFTMGFVLVMFALIVVLNLINSRSGRAIMAIRDNRIAAESMGVNATQYKMMAFVTSAVLAGMAGALYGLNYSTVAASKFKFDTSILVLVFVVLGGIGNMRGSIIAAALLTVLPELLRAFADYRMLVYAIVLIVVMLATNNPQVRQLVQRIIPKRKNPKKEGETA